MFLFGFYGTDALCSDITLQSLVCRPLHSKQSNNRLPLLRWLTISQHLSVFVLGRFTLQTQLLIGVLINRQDQLSFVIKTDKRKLWWRTKQETLVYVWVKLLWKRAVEKASVRLTAWKKRYSVILINSGIVGQCIKMTLRQYHMEEKKSVLVMVPYSLKGKSSVIC